MSALIIRNDSTRTIAWTDEAEQLRQEALDAGAMIGDVSNEAQQANAVEAQQKIKSLVGDVEKARKACKEPVLEFGRLIDGQAAAYRAPLDAELMRLGKIVGDFAALQEAKRKAAEAARFLEQQNIERERLAELARIAQEEADKRAKLEAEEREARRKIAEATNAKDRAEAEQLAAEAKRQTEIANAATLEKIDSINEKFNRESASVPIVETVRAKGQIVREDWKIEVTDLWLLARSHPSCVKIEPRLAEIKELLNAGVKVSGVKAEKQITSTVRTGSPKVLELQLGGER